MEPMDLNIFNLRLPVNIRFSDFDMLSHANNANYLTYLEEARINYFTKVISESEMDWRQEGMILARMEIDFLNKLIEVAGDELKVDLKKNFSTPPSGGSRTIQGNMDTK